MSNMTWTKRTWHEVLAISSDPFRRMYALMGVVLTIIGAGTRTVEGFVPLGLFVLGLRRHVRFYRHVGGAGSGPVPTRSIHLEDRKEVYAALGARFSGNLSVVTGQTGAGKSSLVERLASERSSTREAWAIVREYSGRQCNYVRVPFHDSKQEGARTDDLDVVLGRHSVIVLDQFESILNDPDVAEKTLEVLARARAGGIAGQGQPGSGRILFVVRRERLVDVSALLGDLAWARVFYVPAMTSPSQEWTDLWQPVRALGDPDLPALLFRQMANRGGNAVSLAPDGRLQRPDVSLVSAVMAANVVTWLSATQKLGEWDRNVDTLWGLYFREMAAASGDYHDAMRVFFALSASPDNRALTTSELAYVTNVSHERVAWVVTRLLNSVLRQGGRDRSAGPVDVETLDWSHDVYAEEFKPLSGAFVRAEDQQNIVYFLHRAKRKDRRPDDSPRGEVTRRKQALSGACFGLAVAVMALRCFDPLSDTGERCKTVFSHSLALLGSEPLLDWAFTAIAISLSLWAYYVHRLVCDVFSCAPEHGLAGLWTYVLSIGFLALVVVSALWPGYWLFYAALGALLVSVKFLLVPAPRQGGGERGTRAPEFFRAAGWSTFGAAWLAGVAGLAFQDVVDGQACDGWPLGWSLVAFVGGIFWAVWFCIRQHVGPKRAPTLLGTCRRAWIEHRSLLESSAKQADAAEAPSPLPS